ncbi:hypothetical protein GGQ80_002593 [Sphingomonas jinjuensis]|uniref:Uncharacterized protein n=1 Tax=Sphingomonas jinjuensis TaxID=535907 RepID=A0A840FG94_9SPHN|nr:hypothetical protein [Sphingomonas jinjuensis]MBB4154677.1 hypothetical protein [Sphingomonas jinjuensis]
MRRVALSAGALLFASPVAAQQLPISPLAGGRVMPTQPLATTTGATASSRMKPGAALETGPMRPAMAGGLLADGAVLKDADARDAKDAKGAKTAGLVKKKPAAALGATLVTDDPATASASAAADKIPDIDPGASPGDRRPTAVVVRRPAPVAGPKRQK